MGKEVHNNYITIAKALGIILMVIGHSGCPQVLFRIIYLFHMPLFFFCSGIFYKEMSNIESTSLFLKKRISSLYFPFVKWSLLFMLLHNLFMAVGIYNSEYGFEGGSSIYSVQDIFYKMIMILLTMHDYEELLGGFWFIRALFISSIIIAVFSLLLKNQKRYKHELLCGIFLVLTLLIRRFMPNPEIWRDISMGCLGAFFYMMGNLSKRYFRYWQNKHGAVLCCLFLLLSYYYFKSGISMGCGYNKVLPFSVSAISGTMLILYVSNVFERKCYVIKRVLYYIGNHTLDILALHFLSFRFVSFVIVLLYGINVDHIAEHPVIKDVSMPHVYWWILYSIVGVVLPLLLNAVWKDILKILKRK